MTPKSPVNGHERKMTAERRTIIRRKPASGQARRPARALRPLARIPRWFVPTMLVLLALATLAILLVIRRVRHVPEPLPEPRTRPFHERMTMYRAAGDVLGRYLAEVHGGRRILTLMPPPSRRDDEDAVVLEGIQEALADHADGVALTVAALEDDPDAPAGMWLKPEAFDAGVAAHPAAEVVVSIAGMPLRPERMQFWRWPQRPELVLFHVSPLQLEGLISSGLIDAILVRRPGTRGEPVHRSPDDPRNWLLITSRNLDDVMVQYPSLFAY